MALRFLGKETQNGQSPTLWADGHDYVIQGSTLDPETLAEVGRPGGRSGDPGPEDAHGASGEGHRWSD
jgi:hypothetical protein